MFKKKKDRLYQSYWSTVGTFSRKNKVDKWYVCSSLFFYA